MLFLPFGSDEKKVKLEQVVGGPISHSGFSYTGLDFSIGKDSDVFAMADGVVVAIYNEAIDYDKNKTVTGDLIPLPGAEDSLGDSGYGNFVTVLHTIEIDGEPLSFYASYTHLEQDSMGALEVGDPVTGGETFLGEVGYTGIIIGTHLHVQVGTELNNPKATAADPDFGAEIYSYADGSPTAANLDLISKLTFQTAEGESLTWDAIPEDAELESTVDVDKKADKIAKDFDGFEDPGLAGWDTDGLVTSEASFDVATNNGASPAQPTEGDRMAVIRSGGDEFVFDIEATLGLDPGTIAGTTGSVMSRSVELKGGQDSILFDFYFDAGDYLPYNDAAYVVLNGEAFLLGDVAGTGDYGDTGWQTFGFTGLEKGTYEIAFVSVDLLDQILDSALYVDNFEIA